MDGETNQAGARMVDAAALVRQARASGPLWGRQSDDLNVTLLRFAAGEAVAEHRNDEVDVLLVGVDGRAVVEVDGQAQTLGPGTALLIPKGARRAIRGDGAAYTYLSCHRRRAGLWPGTKPPR